MQYSIIATIAAFAAGSSASTVAQYNGYTDTNCSTINGNAINAIDSNMMGKCTMIHDFSLRLITADPGCKMNVFDDTMCTANNRTVPANTCFTNQGRPFEGFMLQC